MFLDNGRITVGFKVIKGFESYKYFKPILKENHTSKNTTTRYTIKWTKKTYKE